VYVFIFFIPVPIEARWLALGYFLIESLSVWEGVARGMASGTAHAAHVGGFVVGYVWVKFGGRLAAWWKRGRAPSAHRFEDRSHEPTRREQAEVDRILKKIHDQGIDSLSTREKFFLQDMSRRYRDGP
jgi:hypothetical protein